MRALANGGRARRLQLEEEQLVLHTDLEGGRQEGEELAEGGLVQQILVGVFPLGRFLTGFLDTDQS